MKTVFSSVLLIVGLISSTVFVSACNKKKDTIAKIRVIDPDNNAPVSARKVVLKGTSTIGRPMDVNLEMTSQTNASGEAIFNFNDLYKTGQAGMAVLNIEVEDQGTMKQSGIIKIEEEKTNEKTVFLP